MAAFPAYPKLLFQGFAEKPESAIKRSDNESGPAKQLKTKSRVLVKRNVIYLLTSNADRDRRYSITDSSTPIPCC